ncbi:MAG: hypothetical protein DMG88_15850 [Acidobacteria bacterium]|nr:MAG: hypothetical protein DMG88_15850 [Acidobacteriota bacterium]
MSKILIFLLTVAVAASSPAALAVVSGHSSPAAAPSCHQHRSKAPAPGPVNFQCCVSGHHAAIIPLLFEIQSPSVTASTFNFPAHIPRGAGTLTPILIYLSGDPPGIVPLRI